ncbi:MAG: hypothetical protein PVG99_14005, partial [Desulfobacteraceae bacterium]
PVIASPYRVGAKQSHVLETWFLIKYLTRKRLRNLAVKDEIAASPSAPRNDIIISATYATKY